MQLPRTGIPARTHQAMSRPEPGPVARPQDVRRAAQDFEAVFLGQFVAGMMQGLSAQGALGGGDDPFGALLREEYGRLIARSGGIGIAAAVMRQLLRAQEAE
jgi:Rod binding domain-containing protein